ncbi:MAG TPA: hypothetical protein VFX76_01560, partial [Roseiflexaceae bacterium]|nr:hypothetical protein [Roseiflexaceae bacterium]
QALLERLAVDKRAKADTLNDALDEQATTFNFGFAICDFGFGSSHCHLLFQRCLSVLLQECQYSNAVFPSPNCQVNVGTIPVSVRLWR